MEQRQTEQGKEFVKGWNNLKTQLGTYAGLAPLLEDGKLNSSARVLFQIISSYCYLEGYCFATNETLSGKLGLKKGMVKKYLRDLQENDLIEVKMVPRVYGFQRHIFINFDGLSLRYSKRPKKVLQGNKK